MDNKRLLIAAVLSMAVLFLWQMVFPPPEAPAPPRPAVAAAPAATPAAGASGSVPGSSAPGAAPAAAAPLAVASPELPPVQDTEERLEVLENDVLRAEFTNRGARLVSLRVKGINVEVGKAGTPPGDLELVAPRKESPLPFSLVGAAGEPLAANAALFVATREKAPDGERLDFVYRGSQGEVEKSFLLGPDGQMEIVVAAPAEKSFHLLLGPGLRARTAAELASRFELRRAVWSSTGKVETLDPAKVKEPLEIPVRASTGSASRTPTS